MSDLSELKDYVISNIHATMEYAQYKIILEEIQKDLALYLRVKELRMKNFELQQSDGGNAYDSLDALTNEYDDVINNELVSEFLVAETNLCKMVRDLGRALIDGLEFDL